MHQVVFDTSEICNLKGVKHAVFSPGSRNAALSVSFHRNKKIQKYVIVDERSAGFIALGLSQQTHSPVVLCCTSGTALLNYAPAIAEAFYQEIPLVILSADRPPEWIDQWDGQTIRQQNVFANHTKAFYQLPVDLDHPDAQWEYQRKLNEAIDMATTGTAGPVHVNIPFREPFYPKKGEKLSFSKGLKISREIPGHATKLQIDSLFSDWSSKKKKIIVLGQGWPKKETSKLLNMLQSNQHVPVISDIISNGIDLDTTIVHQDLFLQNKQKWRELEPDLILTIGKSIISKNLKLFLRESKPVEWHLSESYQTANPFKTQKNFVIGDIDEVLKRLEKSGAQDPAYEEKWTKADQNGAEIIGNLDSLPYSEFSAFYDVMKVLPNQIDLHLGNSMPVRYANFIGLNNKLGINVFCNRGTSGIDGTNGTAVGHALNNSRLVVLMTGDLSFLYDRNAFFHEYDLSNLRIIVFNNFGGGIFDLIKGPSDLKEIEKEEHFITPHNKDLKIVADDIGFSYAKANDDITLELALTTFFDQSPKPKILEIQTDLKTNRKVYFEIKDLINE